MLLYINRMILRAVYLAAQSCQLFMIPWTVAHQVLLPTEILFSFFPLFFISWRLITLQYCSGFCHTLTRNLYAGQEATVRNGHGTTDWFQIGKGVRQGCILSPCLFNLYAEYIMRNSGLKGAQDGIKIARRISVTSDMQMTPPLWQKVRKN